MTDFNRVLYSKLVRDEATGCLLWRGSLDGSGYGKLNIQGKIYATHRLAWALAHGAPPPGVWVLHRCDRPRCCNVEHLWLGDAKSNVEDRTRKRRHRAAFKLTPEQVTEIHARKAAREYPAGIAAALGLSEFTVRDVIVGRTYRHLHPTLAGENPPG
jgi:hypothetical protein